MSIIELNKRVRSSNSAESGKRKDGAIDTNVLQTLDCHLGDNPTEYEFGYYAELFQAANALDLKQRIAAIVNRLGFSDFSFVRLDDFGESELTLMMTFPAQLFRAHHGNDPYERDMVIPYAKEEMKPIYLSTFYDYILQSPIDTVMTRAIKETRRLNESFGYFDCYNIPLKSRNGEDRVLFSVSQRGLCPAEFKLKMRGYETTLLLLAEAIDLVVARKFPELLAKRDSAEKININRGPLRVLDALANNDLKVGQIADKLCISIVTANKHLETARRALGVKTNYAAIRKAITYGLIKYDN